jgi:hypothetical protein
MNGPVVEYSLCIFNKDRTILIKRLALPCPAPIYALGSQITVDDTSYLITDNNISIVSNDDDTFTAYVTELLVSARS